LHPKFPKAKGLCHWEILLLLFSIVWTALPSSDYYALSATPPSSVFQIRALTISGRRLPPSLLPIGLRIPGGASRVQQEGLKRNALGGVFLAAPSALCGSPVFAWGSSGLPTLPVALTPHCNALVHTPTIKLWFLVYWLTSQARYVRVCISRRAIHASCESPWHFSAKHHVLRACFSLMAPFRTRFSRYEMAHIAHVQRLIGCLYTLRYFYIPPCRFHGTGHIAGRRSGFVRST